MSAEDALFRAQATTSLYEKGGDGGIKYVATLSEATPEYHQLVAIGPQRPDDSRTTNNNVGSPEIVVQVRKRSGEVQLLLDGYVSTGVASEEYANTTVHKLAWHRGLHEDVDTNTRVFSPLAVVAAVEDGQHPFQSVTVSVVHQLHTYDTPVLVPTVLAEAAVVPHRVTDARCGIVHVPYPLAYPSPPTLTIFDNITKLRFDEMRNLDTTSTGWEKAAGAIAKTVGTNMENNPASNWDNVVQAVFASGIAVPAALIVTAATASNWHVVSSVVLAMLSSWATNAPAAGGDEVWEAKLFVALAQGLAQGVKKYYGRADAPPLRKTKFTLAELAATIEALAVRRELAPANEEEFASMIPDEDRVQYKKELIVWNWLLDQDKNLPKPDATKLVASREYTSQIHIRLAVDDALGCDAATAYHEIRCGRDDDCLLAAAAAGSLEDMARLYQAITKLSDVLEDAIANPSRWGWDWIDRARYNGMFAIQEYDTYRRNRPAGRTFAAFRAAWLAKPTPFQEKRKKELTTVRDQLQTKLVAGLFKNDSAGWKLRRAMEQALSDKRCPVPPTQHWVRTLPQRGPEGATRSLFTASVDDSVARVDVQTEGVLTRMFSEYRDASAWLSASMSIGRVALRRYAAEWEASSSTRVLLTCVCTKVADGLPRLKAAAAHSTLALTTPADIRFSEAIAAPTEHAQRRVRLVVQRVRGDYDKSALEALGLAHSDASLLACQVFGDLWVDELRVLWALGNSRQAEMLERASTRASARLRAAGTLLRELLLKDNPSTDLVGDAVAAPSRADPSLVATQAGRDAGRLLDRVLFAQNFLAVRVAMAPLLREAALVAVRAAQAFERTVPVTLPHEPTASLFGDRLDGVAAWLRVRSVAGADAPEVEAATAAYPSVRLLSQDSTEQARYAATAGQRDAPKPHRDNRPMTMRALVRAMRFRLASLRMDVAPALDMASSPTSTVDALAERLSHVAVTAKTGAAFYVPLGFGDARPAPTLPPCAAPMFGSVPVFRGGLVDAFASIQRVLKSGATNAPTSGSGGALRVHLVPIFGCLLPLKGTHDDDETESVHPNVVQVTRGGRDDGVVTVRYAASSLPGKDAQPGGTTHETAFEAANAHTSSEETAALAAEVSSVAWNAERVVQAVAAALASADETQDYDAIELSFALPPDDQGSSRWYTKPNNPMRRAQQKRMSTRAVDTEAYFLDQLRKHYVARTGELVEYVEKAALRDTDDAARFGGLLADYNTRKKTVKERPQEDTRTTWSGVVSSLHETVEGMFTDALIAENADKLQDYESMDVDGNQVQYYRDAGDELKQEFRTTLTNMLNELRALAEFVQEMQNNLLGSLMRGQPEGTKYDAYRVALRVPALTNAAAVARDDAEKRRKRRQYRALVGALGVGMGMLTPLVGGAAALRCVEIERAEDVVPDDPFANWDVASLHEAFAKCEALRFSEACLIVTGKC